MEAIKASTTKGILLIFQKISNSILKNKKDSPFLFLMGRSLCVHLPLVLLIFGLDNPSWWLALPFSLIYIFFLGPHILMVHNVHHRLPWKKPFAYPLQWTLGLLGILYGLPPGLYFYHHNQMHHKEGNGPEDLSSTLPYQRDNFLHWLFYFTRFCLLTWIELPLYFFKKKKYSHALNSLVGFMVLFALWFVAYQYNPKATWITLFIPTLISWFGMMGGNWAQHAFIDQQDPGNDFKSSITVIESEYNRRCFNDGYHIGHHLSPGRHWSDMPADYQRNKNCYLKQGSIIFKTLDYQMIWFLLMIRAYKTLSRYYVNDYDLTSEEIISLLKSKTRSRFPARVVQESENEAA